MGDPLSVAASVAGLLSLGIQVTQSLVTYYIAYRNQDSHITRTTSKLDTLLQLFESLGEALDGRRFHTDEHALMGQIESSIEDCDDLILELQQEFDKFSNDSKSGIKDGIKTTGRRVAYPFRQSTLQKLDEDIGEIRENLSVALSILQLNDDKRIQDDLYEVKSMLDLVRTSQISQELRDWLKAPDATTDHNEACANKHANTGTWFVKGAAFTKWLEDDASFLWLNGFAGCGKSVLSSTAIQYTFRHRRSNPCIGIAFFYFSFKDRSKQDASCLLRAILLQLSSQLKNGHVDLTRLHASYKNGEAPVPALLECVRQLMLKFQDVYLIVDALDESPRHDARERVLDTITDVRAWSLNSLHVLVTSRDEPDIREHINPSSVEDISMKNAGIDKDIEDFIRGRLQRSRALQKWSSYHPRIQKALTAKAGGVFRWVECQFKSLKSCPRSEDHLERLLTSLPQSLDETYERMLLNIDKAFVEDARRVLMWLCFSKRPLTVQELIDGVAIELGDDARLNRKRRLQDENDILQICPGFINVALGSKTGLNARNDTPSPVVSIAHYSVQEYLESDRIYQQKTAFFSIRSTQSDVSIAQMCLVYLRDPVLSKAKVSHSALSELPLAKYAAKYWYDHIKGSETFSTSVHSYVIQLYRDRGHAFRNSINIYDHDGPIFGPSEGTKSKVGSEFYYAALLGFDSVLSELFEAQNGQFSVVEEHTEPILTNALDVNAQGGYYGNALQAASARGHEKVVQLLLDKGADFHAQGGHYGNALQAASGQGHEKLVQILLDKGADVHAQGGEYGNALQAASVGGHEKLVQLLLDKGADFHAQGEYYGNALQAASARGHEKLVQILLDKGADVNRQGGRYGTALCAALSQYSVAIIESLLQHGAQPSDCVYVLSKLLTGDTNQQLRKSYFYALSRCLIFLDLSDDARFCSKQHSAYCNICTSNITGSCSVCTTCGIVDFCYSCTQKQLEGHGLETCQTHEFLEVDHVQSVEDDNVTNAPLSERVRAWLGGLIYRYEKGTLLH